ncbi:hypothetical protein EG328_000263 [Venturia inaequalis]|uniref:Uncharacterized protein n=1 Tax=Venturia inaequalis TaxID=5025 RepID=A0A8H3V3T9_VENIN|nr:hypothetical protein EG328_000263 [Venturia inaequalis]KAE9989985.1 hypothetical protein EG327_001997 [Venturia inaequalis]
MGRRRVALSQEQRRSIQEKAQHALIEEAAPEIFNKATQRHLDRVTLYFETLCSDVLNTEPLGVLLRFCDREPSAIADIKN